MRVLFRCDAGPRYGLGRLFRCLALADAFAKAGAEPVFAVHGADAGLPALPFVTLNLSMGRGDDHAELLSKAAKEAELVVVDAEEVGSLELARLRAALGSARLAVVDDRAGSYILASAVINPNPTAYLYRYDLSPDCKTILGASFAMIRPDMVDCASRPASGAAPSESTPRMKVLVSLGAYDAGATETALELLDAIDLELELVVLLSRAAPGFERVEERAKTARHATRIESDPANAPSACHGAAMGLCAGGTTALELACLGVPGAYLVIRDEFEEMARVLTRNGFGITLGRPREEGPESVRQKIALLLKHPMARMGMSRNARMGIDGKGAERVLAKLSKYGIIPL